MYNKNYSNEPHHSKDAENMTFGCRQTSLKIVGKIPCETFVLLSEKIIPVLHLHGHGEENLRN